jgi:hypothetical protein
MRRQVFISAGRRGHGELLKRIEESWTWIIPRPAAAALRQAACGAACTEKRLDGIEYAPEA